MDLGVYTLKSRSEITQLREKIGEKKFDEFKLGVYNIFRNLKPGEIFPIEEKVSKPNIPVFIKLACLYQLDTGWNCNIAITGHESNLIKGTQTLTEILKENQIARTRRNQRNRYYEKEQ